MNPQLHGDLLDDDSGVTRWEQATAGAAETGSADTESHTLVTTVSSPRNIRVNSASAGGAYAGFTSPTPE
jgi:hypothetical protein